MLEGLKLANCFRYISPDGRREYFHGLYDAVGIDNVSATYVHTGSIFVDSVYFADFTACIGQQWEGHSIGDKFRQFHFLPDFVRKAAIGADGHNVNAEVL